MQPVPAPKSWQASRPGVNQENFVSGQTRSPSPSNSTYTLEPRLIFSWRLTSWYHVEKIMIKALLPRTDYPSLTDWIYLNQASLGLVGEPAVQAMHHFLDEVARHGNLNMTDEDEVQFFESLRQRGTQILNCQPDQLAILASASELLGQLPFMLRPQGGSNILAVSTDFPAITRPWLRYCAENSCSMRFVEDVATVNLTDSLIERIDEETAVIAISYVQFATGSIIDVPRLRRAAQQVGAKLIVDVTQAAGRIRIDSASWQADAVVTSGYKWLGGHGGVALAALAPHLSNQIPPLPGWMGANNPFDFEATQLPVANGSRRFTQSTISYVSLVGLTTALDQLLAFSGRKTNIQANQGLARDVQSQPGIREDCHENVAYCVNGHGVLPVWLAQRQNLDGQLPETTGAIPLGQSGHHQR